MSEFLNGHAADRGRDGRRGRNVRAAGLGLLALAVLIALATLFDAGDDGGGTTPSEAPASVTSNSTGIDDSATRTPSMMLGDPYP
ncbi:hypothetical protein [Blastococcus sp. Marseille-P5729]|uniref:hypothetical protein n=1 Tax=Blastococcus sp. Marseille-P5729 TaxID=2086582 RepID=UPI00131DCACE|nr:hypothetical protein [Blastococcus sp. Marseille-P5729]